RARRGARQRPADAGRRAGPVLDDLRHGWRRDRRPDRLPARAGAVPRRGQRRQRDDRLGRAGFAARGLAGRARRSVARDVARRHPGATRRRGARTADRSGPQRIANEGPDKRLVGLVVTGRGIARHGYPVDAGERRTGVVTSGTQSPTLAKPIAMAYVAPDDGEPGTILAVEVREQPVSAEVVPLPFYKRSTT